MKDDPRTVADALARLRSLKEEHRPIVDQVAADPGMSPETRAMLLRHLNEEEEEWLDRATELLGRTTTPTRRNVPGLTVGSLRQD